MNKVNSIIVMAACLLTAGNITEIQATVTSGEKGASLLVQAQKPGTAAQRKWLEASPADRIRIAEGIGEKGARNWARAQGWKPLLESAKKTVPQGPDMIYRGKDGTVHVLEAKGGSGQLSHSYGYPQGSSEWAVKSAERILRSKTASETEKRAAQAVLDAAAEGRLKVHVVRTPHILGQPKPPILEQTVDCTQEASKLANAIKCAKSLSASSGGESAAAKAVDEVVRVVPEETAAAAMASTEAADRTVVAAACSEGNALRYVSRGAVVVCLAVDAGMRAHEAMNVERRYEAGEITASQRLQSHAENAAGMAGGWGGAAAAGNLGAEGGAALGSVLCPGVGTVVGGVLGGIGGGIVGYMGGKWIAEEAVGTLAQWFGH